MPRRASGTDSLDKIFGIFPLISVFYSYYFWYFFTIYYLIDTSAGRAPALMQGAFAGPRRSHAAHGNK